MPLKDLGGFLLHGCLSCLTSTTAATALFGLGTTGVTPVLVGLANTLTGDLASEHFSALVSFKKLKDRLSTNDPDKINHDLERLFKEAAIVSVTFIRKLFLAELKKDPQLLFGISEKERKEILRSAESFLEQNEKDLRHYIADEPVDKLQIKEPAEFLTYIIDYLIGVSIVDLDDATKQRLRDFYIAKLPYCFELAFKEALKGDDKGFKAFQIWVFENIQAQQAHLVNLVEEIQHTIDNLKRDISPLTQQELDAMLDRYADVIYRQLEVDFKDIKDILQQLALEIKENFAAQYQILVLLQQDVHTIKETTTETAADVKAMKAGVEEVKVLVTDFKNNQLPVIPHHLTKPPFLPQVFFGRREELEVIKEKLFAGNNMLLLVNGEGGVGKTSLASKYYHTYQNLYAHLAWVLSEKSIANALLLLATPLHETFKDDQSTKERLDQLLTKMASLSKPCLLVIDNANEIQDLKKHYQDLRSCSNFHLLLTTRITKFAHAASYKIEGLPEEEALLLFRKHYDKHTDSENGIFFQIRQAVGGNTLVIELLAKNLKLFNRPKVNYTLQSLLADLQERGLLFLSKSAEVGEIDYQAKGGVMRAEKPEAIIEAMYDLSDLANEEAALLSVFAVLPAESILYDTLQTLVPDDHLDNTLLGLAQKGWLDFNEEQSSFKVSPVVQEISRKKNTELAEDCATLISSLIDQLDYNPGTGHFINCSYQQAALYARYAESITRNLREVNNSLAVLSERVGSYYKTTGNLDKALSYYQQYNVLEKELYEAYPDNVEFKNNLAISYQNLGNIQSSLGNLDKALSYYQQLNQLEKELYEAYPDNVDFKNGLAISYSKLGEIQSSLGNLDKALSYYQQYNILEKELCEAYPDNVGFKNSLALSYAQLGVLYKEKLLDKENAKLYFQLAEQLWIALVSAFPAYPKFKNYLELVRKELDSL